MSIAPPFRITAADIERRDLERGDLGAWALVVAGCCHLFETEGVARRAYRLWLEGVAVR